MVILISYDLNKYERPEAYEAVKDMIHAHADSTKKALYSQWFVETTDSVQAWHERMKTVTDDNDYWFITKIGASRQGWLSKSVWEWLDSRV